MLHVFQSLEIVCMKESNREKQNLKIYVKLTPVLKITSKRNKTEGIEVAGQIHEQKALPGVELPSLLRSVKQGFHLATTAV